jgi:hypothetical protein
MNKSCRIFLKVSRLVKFIIFDWVYLQLWNFEGWCSILGVRNIQLLSMVNYTILETFYAKPYIRKVVDNIVLHNLVKFGSFWICGLKSTKKRRVSAAVLIGSANGRCLNVWFGALYCVFVIVLAGMFVLLLSIACDQVIALWNVASDFDLLR